MMYIDSFLKNGIKPLPLDILGADEWIKWLNFRPKTEEEIEMAALSKIYRTDKISFSDAKKYYNYVSKNSINSIIKKRLTSEELEEAKNRVREIVQSLSEQELRVYYENMLKSYASLSVIDSYVVCILARVVIERNRQKNTLLMKSVLSSWDGARTRYMPKTLTK